MLCLPQKNNNLLEFWLNIFPGGNCTVRSLLKAFRWADFRDGLIFEMGFFSSWASFRDGLLFEMGFFSRWASFRDGLLFEMGFF